MNYKAAGGPSVTMLRHVFRRLAATGRIAAVSFSSWNPQLDADGQSQKVCLALLGELLGQRLDVLPVSTQVRRTSKKCVAPRR
jgi:arginase family enzyme